MLRNETISLSVALCGKIALGNLRRDCHWLSVARLQIGYLSSSPEAKSGVWIRTLDSGSDSGLDLAHMCGKHMCTQKFSKATTKRSREWRHGTDIAETTVIRRDQSVIVKVRWRFFCRM